MSQLNVVLWELSEEPFPLIYRVREMGFQGVKERQRLSGIGGKPAAQMDELIGSAPPSVANDSVV